MKLLNQCVLCGLKDGDIAMSFLNFYIAEGCSVNEEIDLREGTPLQK
jgi:hypothetical protein